MCGLRLTAAGLEFDTSRANPINVAVPFPTDGSGTVQITTRLRQVSGMSVDFDLVGVGFGVQPLPFAAFSANAIVYHNSFFGGPL